MNPRLYRLTELHQHIDQALRLELSRRIPDPFELIRLRSLKQAVKRRLRLATLRLGRA